MTFLLIAIGFIVGLWLNAMNSGEAAFLMAPFIGMAVGGILGFIADAIINKIKGVRNKTFLVVALVALTVVCYGVTAYTFHENWEFIYENSGLADLMELDIIYGAINMLLFPFVMFFVYQAPELMLGYGVALAYAIVLSIMYVNSAFASSADEHEGKYEVLVDTTTGAEVGERRMLDPNAEAWKANAIAVVIICLLTMALPFLACSIGITFAFNKQLSRVSFAWTAVIVAVLTIAPYILFSFI